MKKELIFSLHTDQHVKDAVNIYGYAYGYNRISKHFNEFKYGDLRLHAAQNSPEAPIQMFYMEPEWYNQTTMTDNRPKGFHKFYDHQYKIYGTHLEATKVWPHWIDSMNAVDEIWVGNYFARDAVLNSGITTPVFVFEHGIDDMWKPFKRGKNKKIKFLHIDSDSPRKRVDLVEKAFTELFGNSNEYELTLKYHNTDKITFTSFDDYINGKPTNINSIYQTLSQEEMVELYHNHDILVYPSEGEGFGFIPLQALATGMPTISTGRWCSYEKYLLGNVIESKLGKTSHTGYFAGDVVLAEYESLKYLMKKVADDIEYQSEIFYNQASDVYAEYNWQNKCDQMLNGLIDRVGIKMFKPLAEFKPEKVNYIKYCGRGSYMTVDGIKFTNDKPIAAVNKNNESSLLMSGLFEKPSIEEILKIDPYYSPE